LATLLDDELICVIVFMFSGWVRARGIDAPPSMSLVFNMPYTKNVSFRDTFLVLKVGEAG